MNLHASHPMANQELQDAFAHYESKRPGLGDELLDAVDVQLAFIESDPFQSSPCVENPEFRYRTLHRFPYAICFGIVDGKAWIVAFAHHARRPNYWLDRIDDIPRP